MYIDAYEKDCDPGEPDVVEGDGPVERVGRSSSAFREILNWLFNNNPLMLQTLDRRDFIVSVPGSFHFIILRSFLVLSGLLKVHRRQF